MFVTTVIKPSCSSGVRIGELVRLDPFSSWSAELEIWRSVGEMIHTLSSSGLNSDRSYNSEWRPQFFALSLATPLIRRTKYPLPQLHFRARAYDAQLRKRRDPNFRFGFTLNSTLTRIQGEEATGQASRKKARANREEAERGLLSGPKGLAAISSSPTPHPYISLCKLRVSHLRRLTNNSLSNSLHLNTSELAPSALRDF
jgi:hypothetical protein